MINLDEVGAFGMAPTAAGIGVRFGLYLPGITPGAGYQVVARVIHQDDRFVPEIKPLDFPLQSVAGHPLGLWQAQVTLPTTAGTHFGQPGTYLYRFQLLRSTGGAAMPSVVTRWFTDPFARLTDDVGELSAFTTPGSMPDFAWTDDAWKVPELADLVVYELHVEEFNDTFDGVVDRIDYLKSLGVTCLELMPVSSLKLDFDWGYGPLHYFAPNQRWGGEWGVKKLVNACHAKGVAVILDVVYQHVDPSFPYALVYQNAGLASPMISGNGPFGPEIDYNQEFARDYLATANRHWLSAYHVDGFRYDEVTDLYDGPTGVKYAKLAYDTYDASLKLPRFTPSGGTKPGEYSRIIQVAEALNRPQEILRSTYSNGTWQDNLLSKVADMARYGYVDDSFALLLDARFNGYPDTKTVHDVQNQPVDMPVAPFQYLESHDHTQLMAWVGVGGQSPTGPFADRSAFYKLQPFAIALYTSQGTPMLWEGQEFAESWVLPDSGDARVHFRRNVHWEYFYDDEGSALIRLYRILGNLRHAYPALRSRESYYDNIHSRPADGVIVYRRSSTPNQQTAMVFLNFSDHSQGIAAPFPDPGSYREMIDDGVRTNPYIVNVGQSGQMVGVEVPSHYGFVFVKG